MSTHFGKKEVFISLDGGEVGFKLIGKMTNLSVAGLVDTETDYNKLLAMGGHYSVNIAESARKALQELYPPIDDMGDAAWRVSLDYVTVGQTYGFALKALLAKPGAPAKDSGDWKMLHLWWAVLTALVCTKS